MLLALIDYGSGNLRSAAKAIQRAADDNGIALDLRVTDRVEDVAHADRIVLPGVGAFADCYRGLAALDGMIAALNERVIRQGRPFLGICVGMQLMATVGREHGEHRGLGWIEGAVEKLQPSDPALKVPHMGWNALRLRRAHPVLAGLQDGAHAYFVHSYHMRPRQEDVILADTDYGGPVLAVLGRDNLVGTQFHPEKSQATGLTLLANFLRWTP
ncbi:MAG TPA: imidazole glycerol phosphate synthase subunit HisH [Ferrovibrio sp.]|jgi:glutamine amidotransferase|uniref:imidazole glycerol phosphate synthase subunit HisH n=1 Tax=Ferrovibrio sp. TaxID=1917215 RepID=UPI002B4AFD69|nr:imidazole glycerol phosphate synthase subunit HisH [Ferrovibrio sp.]HLT76018.1 imidazole glycerol phosphate synthase subunit HisH [Ferrovibrio sp.]